MFEGRVAVVTGVGSGIGAAMAAELRRRRAVVVTADLVGGDHQLDVRDRPAFIAAIDDVVAEHGRIDLLFNNAGISTGGESHLMDGSYFDRVIDVNLRGVVRAAELSNAVVLAMIRPSPKACGIPPSGNAVRIPVFDLFQIRAAQVVAHWGVMDTAGLMA